ncbi:DUF2490 domain-containing protein [Rhizorhabdus sp. FW153]|uniref:DUF2490 domain-containing protein n=1 Tax=Rhizorhabdus sp. FW153 TaxID=3400216 RepID=UPI003CF2F19A
MKIFRALLAGLCLISAAQPAFSSTTKDEQAWVNLTVMGTLTGKIVYFAEVQPRFGDGVSRLDQLLLRPAVGVKLSPTMTLYQGYARVITKREGARDLREHRSFQQLSWVMGKPWGGEFSTRTRLEQRWRADGDDVGHRLREMVRLEVPVASNGLAALGYAEGFIAFNDTDWGARSGFDQLRSFVGAEIPVVGKTTIELGYLNQLVNQTGGRRRMNHVLSFALFARL